MSEIYLVTKEFPCRWCGSKTPKSCSCKGYGVDSVRVGGPVSVLVWQDAAVVPGTPDWYLLAFSASSDLIGVGLATYDSVNGWKLIGGHFDYEPVAYAAVVLPEGFKDAFKTTRR